MNILPVKVRRIDSEKKPEKDLYGTGIEEC